MYLLLQAGEFPEAAGRRNDEVFGLFIVSKLPTGVVGVLVAAVLAAAMSTLSSSLNSSANAAVTDFYRPLRPGRPEGHYVRVSRLMTAAWGVAQMGVAYLAYRAGGNKSVVEQVLAVAGFTTGLLLGLFLLGSMRGRYGPGRRWRGWCGVRGGVSGVAAVVRADGRWACRSSIAAVLAWPWFAPVGAGQRVRWRWPSICLPGHVQRTVEPKGEPPAPASGALWTTFRPKPGTRRRPTSTSLSARAVRPAGARGGREGRARVAAQAERSPAASRSSPTGCGPAAGWCTSGRARRRLGVLDASECPPTFNSPPTGGGRHRRRAGRPDARDRRGPRTARAAAATRQRNLSAATYSSASRRAVARPTSWPGSTRGHRRVHHRLCRAIRGRNSSPGVDLQSRPSSGPEVLSGSTRLKAGTATKLVLNMLSTARWCGSGRPTAT
jgi:hypothetical protein